MDAAEKIVGKKYRRNQLPYWLRRFCRYATACKRSILLHKPFWKALHSPHFTLDTSILPIGASVLAKVVEED